MTLVTSEGSMSLYYVSQRQPPVISISTGLKLL